MNWLEITTVGVLAFFVIQQGLAVAIYLAYCGSQAKTPLPREFPEVKVILPLRGADPCLADCVRGLLAQDYDDFQVHIIVDRRDDPAWQVVQQVLDETRPDNVQVSALVEPGDRCSLKCSAVLQGTQDLSPACQVVALLDADVVPQRQWLRKLVGPLASQGVGASMGNRWYLPRTGGWGSLVRYCWNGAAVVTMYFWEVPWGGSLAIKTRVIRESDLRDRWSRSGCDDVPLYDVLRHLKLKLKVVTSLMLINRDECDLGSCTRFVSRQLLWVRLYRPACWWASNVLHLVAVGFVLLAAALSVTALLAGRYAAAAWLTGGVALDLAGMCIVLMWLERAVIPAGEAMPPRRRMIPAILLAQLVMPVAIWSSLTARTVVWRGIEYRIDGPWNIRLVKYLPYVHDVESTEASEETTDVSVGATGKAAT